MPLKPKIIIYNDANTNPTAAAPSNNNKENIKPGPVCELLPSKIVLPLKATTSTSIRTPLRDIPVGKVLDLQKFFESGGSVPKPKCTLQRGRLVSAPTTSTRCCSNERIHTNNGDETREAPITPVFVADRTGLAPNNLTDPDTLLVEVTQIGNQAVIRRKPTSKRHQRIYDSYSSYTCDILVEDYIEDIYQYFRSIEHNFVLGKNYLTKFHPNQEFRPIIINWMIKTQKTLNFSGANLHTAVHLFDRVLAVTAVPTNVYQLLAITTIRIASKLGYTPKTIKSSSLLSLCNNVYSMKKLSKLERTVLKLLDFRTNIDRLQFVYYYMRLIDNRHNKLLGCSTKYILDCFMLSDSYSSVPSSLLCLTAVNLALSFNLRKHHNFFEHILTEYNNHDVFLMESEINEHLLKMLDEDCRFKEAYYKYKSRDRMNVSGTIVTYNSLQFLLSSDNN